MKTEIYIIRKNAFGNGHPLEDMLVTILKTGEFREIYPRDIPLPEKLPIMAVVAGENGVQFYTQLKFCEKQG